jgi:putative hemolysin
MNAILTEAGIILVLLLANGLFSMTEIAVVSARKSRLRERADRGDSRARAALDLAENPNRFLATVQVGITLVGVLAAAFGGARLTAELTRLLRPVPGLEPFAESLSFGLVVALITLATLIIGELVPKRLGLANPEGVAVALAGPMNALSRLAAPLVNLLGWCTDALIKVCRLPSERATPVNEEDVKLLVREGMRAGVFHPGEPAMVEGVLGLDRLSVRELMTPRAKIIWINVSDSHESIWHKVVVSGHTTFPVYEGNRDLVVGMVTVKAIYAHLAAGLPVRIKDLMTAPLVVPASQSAATLLETFKRSGKHLALVADEFGGIVGLVSLHDLMEAIIGEFPSQDERLRPRAQQRGDGSWLVDAAIELNEFARALPGFELPPGSGRDFRTFAGFVFQHLGHIPTEGESFVWQDYTVEIIDMDGHRVDKVLLLPRRPPTSTSASGSDAASPDRKGTADPENG